MAKKIELVGVKPKRIEVIDQPKMRIKPTELAASLGANPTGEQAARTLDLIDLAELGTQMIRSSRVIE